MNIPKPVNKKVNSKNHDMEYLDKWKELFEALHSEIKVYLNYNNESCHERLARENSHARLDNSFRYPEIFIELPQVCGMRYLAGLKYDKMFSDVEVMNDEAYFEQENDAFDCEPQVEKWEYFYNLVHKNVEESKNTIPPPPQNEK